MPGRLRSSAARAGSLLYLLIPFVAVAMVVLPSSLLWAIGPPEDRRRVIEAVVDALRVIALLSVAYYACGLAVWIVCRRHAHS